jgi:hypothetical protein
MQFIDFLYLHDNIINYFDHPIQIIHQILSSFVSFQVGVMFFWN